MAPSIFDPVLRGDRASLHVKFLLFFPSWNCSGNARFSWRETIFYDDFFFHLNASIEMTLRRDDKREGLLEYLRTLDLRPHNHQSKDPKSIDADPVLRAYQGKSAMWEDRISQISFNLFQRFSKF